MSHHRPPTTDDQDRALAARLRLGPADPAAGDGAAASALDRFRRAADTEGLVDVAWASVDSPVGPLVVAATRGGVVLLSWDLDASLERLAHHVSPRVLHAPGRLDDARRQLDEYFEHRRDHFDLPIDWALSRGFRREVLVELARVPFGRIVTYGELAARVGRPGASRAVGTAMATNPIAIVVPCHRVVQAGGRLGNYSGRDGVVTKRWLLEMEGATGYR